MIGPPQKRYKERKADKDVSAIFQGGETVVGVGLLANYLVDSENDLTTLPEGLPPGSVAYTADLTGMWQKGPDGNWHKIGGDD